MTRPDVADVERDHQAYRRAAELLREGRLQEGAQLLGRIAEKTTDAALNSQCLFNLGELLEQLGRGDEAYRTWCPLAHKPPAQRRPADVAARVNVVRMFDQHALHLPVPDFPPKVQLEITNRCNLRCIMCTRNQMNRGLGDISFETFQKVADEWCTEPVGGLCLYFLGEPLLHRELERLIAYLVEVKKKHPGPSSITMQTNGMLLTKDRAGSLIEAGLRNFAFSLDGLEGDLERIRSGASYPVVEKNILDLLDLGREMGVDDLGVDVTKLCDDPEAAEVKRFLEVWKPRVRLVAVIAITKVPGNAYMTADGTIRQIEAPGSAGPPHKAAYCGQGQRLLVLWNGDFAFCTSDVNGEMKLGNIHDRSIREVWHSPEINEIRRKIFAADYSGLSACEVCPSGGRKVKQTPLVSLTISDT